MMDITKELHSRSAPSLIKHWLSEALKHKKCIRIIVLNRVACVDLQGLISEATKDADKLDRIQDGGSAGPASLPGFDVDVAMRVMGAMAPPKKEEPKETKVHFSLSEVDWRVVVTQIKTSPGRPK